MEACFQHRIKYIYFGLFSRDCWFLSHNLDFITYKLLTILRKNSQLQDKKFCHLYSMLTFWSTFYCKSHSNNSCSCHLMFYSEDPLMWVFNICSFITSLLTLSELFVILNTWSIFTHSVLIKPPQHERFIFVLNINVYLFNALTSRCIPVI